VLVSVDEVLAEYGSEELWGVDRVQFGRDVSRLLHGVCSHNNSVVCFGVPETSKLGRVAELNNLRYFDFAFEQDTDCHLGDSLDIGNFISLDLIYANVVLAIAGSSELRHVDDLVVVVLEAWGCPLLY